MRSFYRVFRIQNLLKFACLIFFVYFIKSLLNILFPRDLESSKDFSYLPRAVNFISDFSIAKKPKIHNVAESNLTFFKPKTLEKIDWHNYTSIKIDAKRKGLGEQGIGHNLGKPGPISDQLYKDNGFNAQLSDLIPFDRSLPDIRHRGCKKKVYLKDLPDVSVVVPFHNEHFSTLIRTAYSVMLRSPRHLIKEIFLVDDASTKEELKQQLDTYVSKNLPKVKIIRLEHRSGLITARLEGAKAARGAVLIFLDAHSEANVNWLPPLLEPIALNPRTCVCPFIDVIAYDSFEYRAQDEGARGAFDWEFFYKRLPLLPRDIHNMPEPFESPVMAGGLFAISRFFFWELGGYDPGLDIWGGEQYELSFKIWQCGGRLIDAPCSRVGHIYRKFAPFPNPGHGDFVAKNYRRVAEVWMDEYAKYLYRRRPHYLSVDPGDLSEQRDIRKKLNCKPFRWFMTQIAFDLTAKYPVQEPKPFGEGKIRPVMDTSKCVDMGNDAELSRLRIGPCADGHEIHFLFSWHRDIRSKKRAMCWDVPEVTGGVVLYSCHGEQGNQLWKFIPETQQLKWGGGEKCLKYNTQYIELVLDQCNVRDEAQRWAVDTIHHERIKEWGKFSRRITGPVEKWP